VTIEDATIYWRPYFTGINPEEPMTLVLAPLESGDLLDTSKAQAVYYSGILYIDIPALQTLSKSATLDVKASLKK